VTTFTYIARDSAGQRVTGTLSGASEQSVLAELQSRDLAPVRVEEVREQVVLKRRVSIRQLATAYHQLADLLRAGVPLLRGLRLLGRSKANPRLGSVFMTVADAVADGARLADALDEHGDVIPSIQVAMVRAGERGGFLEDVLARLGAFLEHQADLRARVIGNLFYPAILMLLSSVIVVTALVFFVPKFEPYYQDMPRIPVPTQIVLAASAMLTTYWLPTLLGAAFVVAVAWWAIKRPKVRRTLAVWQLRIPKIGPLFANLAVARFSRMLGTLLQNGVPLLAAMQIARDSAGTPLLEDAIDEATEAVRAGETLAGPLSKSGLFAEDVVEMISVGESANNLPGVLSSIAEAIETRVDRMLNILVRLMEPLLLVIMGGVVMFIFVALVVPMMQMSANL
jgi:general secretion pathway protein F/type IV pilus assembly protein PilC